MTLTVKDDVGCFQLYDYIPDGIRIIDTKFNVTYVNTALAQMKGLSAKEIVGKKCYETCSGPLCYTPRCPLERVLKGEENLEAEVEMTRQDGLTAPYIVTVSSFRDEFGAIIGILECFKDITKLKQTETALRIVNDKLKREITEHNKAEEIIKERERHYEAVLRVLPAGLFQADEKGICVYVNQETSDILKMPPNDIKGKGWIRAIHPDDRTRVLCEWDKCMRNKQLFTMEYRLKRWDGSIVWVHARAVPYEGFHGQVWYVGSLIDITCYVTSQQALRDNEAKFKSYIDKSPDGIFIVTESGRYIDVNPTGCHMLGYNKEELMKLTIADVASPEIGFGHVQWLKETGEIVTRETAIRKKDGSYLEVELKAVPVNDNCFMAFVRDITARKQVEAALKKSEEQYRLIFENSPLGIFHFNQQGHITACNDRFIEILGSTREKLIGFNMLTELRDNELKDAVKLALEGGYGYYNNLYQSVTSGKVVPLELILRGIISEKGELLGTVGICEDITERNKAEEALRQSELYNDLIINGVSENLMLYEVIDNDEFRFLKANNNVLKMLGLREEELIGRSLQEVLPAETAEQWQQNNRMAVETGRPISFAEDNKYGHFETNLIPIVDKEKNCSLLLVSALNVTEKKKMQEQQLQAEKLRSLGLLAGGIAHDFNNILTVIAGNISLSRMKLNNLGEEYTAEVSALLDEAEKASLEARHLTQQLLTFAKGGEPITKAVSIGDLIKETANFVLRGSNVKCKYLLPEDLWPVQVDKGLISQVIQNLIINVNQAMPDGGIVIISAENVTVNNEAALPLKEGQYVKVSIRDHGHGIPPEYVDKIFDPYFTSKQAGSGLGLTIVHSIIMKHNGHIDVQSSLGNGTVFNFYLPASIEQLVEKPAFKGKPLNGKGKILLMDDEEALRKIVGEMLTFLGYQVDCVKDGSELLLAYKAAIDTEEPFDGVVMDLTIPGGMGGRETIKKLLEIDPEAKAIVASGYSNDPVMAKFREHGFLAVVRKPFSIEELGAALKQVLS